MTLWRPLYLEATGTDPVIDYTAQDDRQLIGALAPTNGVTWKNDLKVAQRGAGANMSVDVPSGQFTVTGSSIANQGTYIGLSDSTVNVSISAEPGSNSRIDLIVAQVYDNQADGLGSYAWTPVAVTGTAASSPTVPATPANALPLAQVTVASGVSSILTANIKDVRTLNLRGDRPSWQLTGGNGQTLPSGASTPYTGWTFSDLIGVDTTANGGEISLRQAGRYAMTLTQRYTNGGTAATEKTVYVGQNRAGSFYRRVGSQGIVMGAALSGGIPLTAAGTARCNVGDTLRGFAYQNSGATLNLDDSDSELTFTGHWVSP